MTNEIGSEFWDVPICETENGLFSDSVQWFLSGRSALISIVKRLKECHTVAIPSWCCDSMIKPFLDQGIHVCFYPVYWEAGLHQKIRQDCDVILVMDYFGYSASKQDLSQYKGIVIRDVTHSIFTTVYSDADYYFGSLRKWCGMWTGGYAWYEGEKTQKEESIEAEGYIALRKKAMRLKNEYIEDKRRDKKYLKLFEQAESILEGLGAVSAAERDIILANHLDLNCIKRTRRSNARVLMEAFRDWLLFPKMMADDCPLFVPVFVPGGRRDELRSHLISNEIYCPVHWPISKKNGLDSRFSYIYENELSLVCDQRYTENDMYRMVKIIKNFMEE